MPLFAFINIMLKMDDVSGCVTRLVYVRPTMFVRWLQQCKCGNLDRSLTCEWQTRDAARFSLRPLPQLVPQSFCQVLLRDLERAADQKTWNVSPRHNLLSHGCRQTVAFLADLVQSSYQRKSSPPQAKRFLRFGRKNCSVTFALFFCFFLMFFVVVRF